MHQPTIEKLHAPRLGAMANALTAQLQQPEIDAMPFAERLALLVDIQHSAMLTAALAQRLTRAGMRQSPAWKILTCVRRADWTARPCRPWPAGCGSANTVTF
jgi:hypothetical protein